MREEVLSPVPRSFEATARHLMPAGGPRLPIFRTPAIFTLAGAAAAPDSGPAAGPQSLRSRIFRNSILMGLPA